MGDPAPSQTPSELWGIPTSNAPEDQQTLAQKTTAHIPPPPSEVTVRTMASDLHSMAQTGGNRPRPKSVAFQTAAVPQTGASLVTRPDHPNRLLGLVLAVLGAIVVVALAVFFLLRAKSIP
ncbi:MAG: hypothetical protein HY978_03365 [Candidatus Liptonbacteria bacterium]|nr:hypothetical protein [Candidatus Liptonbacteria bacterium]